MSKPKFDKSKIRIVCSVRDVSFGGEYWVSGKEQADKYLFTSDGQENCHVYSCTLEEWEREVRDDLLGKKSSMNIYIDVALPNEEEPHPLGVVASEVVPNHSAADTSSETPNPIKNMEAARYDWPTVNPKTEITIVPNDNNTPETVSSVPPSMQNVTDSQPQPGRMTQVESPAPRQAATVPPEQETPPTPVAPALKEDGRTEMTPQEVKAAGKKSAKESAEAAKGALKHEQAHDGKHAKKK